MNRKYHSEGDPVTKFELLDRQECIDLPNLEAGQKYNLLQLKYDGIWTKILVSRGVARWVSRTNDCKQTKETLLPDGVYIGEFMYGSNWSQHAERLGKTFLFDFIWDGNTDLRLLEYSLRHRILSGRVPHGLDDGFSVVSNVDINLARSCWDRVVSQGYEGLVFRRGEDDFYSTCGRLKREVTCDYVVLDVVEGDGKHSGRLGALVLGLFKSGVLAEIGKVGGGFNDAQRDDIWRAWPRDQNRVVTVKGNTLYETGNLRHPNFVGFREDKRPDECVFEKLFPSRTAG